MFNHDKNVPFKLYGSKSYFGFLICYNYNYIEIYVLYVIAVIVTCLYFTLLIIARKHVAPL